MDVGVSSEKRIYVHTYTNSSLKFQCTHICVVQNTSFKTFYLFICVVKNYWDLPCWPTLEHCSKLSAECDRFVKIRITLPSHILEPNPDLCELLAPSADLR